jgi:hypothetical protein
VDYFAARTLDAEQTLLQNTVAQYEQALQLNEERYKGGLASEVEVEQARTILETTRAQLVDVGVARAQYEHAAAVLVGKPPEQFSLPPLPPRSFRECSGWHCKDRLLSTRQYCRVRRIRKWNHYYSAPRTKRSMVGRCLCSGHHS